MPHIDRSKVRKSFERGSYRYDEIVVVQKKVVQDICLKIQGLPLSNSSPKILDVGAGTGMLLRLLRKMYPDALLAGLDLARGMGSAALGTAANDENFLYVEGDAEKLPFVTGTFDLVVSTSVFQWLNTLDLAFSEALRVLAPGGVFLLALFGEETLCELKKSYRTALRSEDALNRDHTHRFFTCEDVEKTFAKLDFLDISVERGIEKEFYPDVRSLLRSLKGIGAGNAMSSPANGLGGRRLMENMSAAYQDEYFNNGRIPATYEVVYGKGVKA